MLREAGYKEEDGADPKDDEDLSTAGERRLGALVKEKFGTDYYILGQYLFSVLCAIFGTRHGAGAGSVCKRANKLTIRAVICR